MLKFITEFGPLVAFFVGYKTGGIISATVYMLICSCVAMSLTLIFKKKVNKINVISTVILLISGGLTIFSGNTIFIKMKPTVLYSLFAAILFFTNMRGTPAIKFILGATVKLKDEQYWSQLNARFMVFFILMAATNEIVWRSFSEESWVNFKVFGALPITMIFTFSQVPFIMRNSDKT